jgi:hypothetical protein
MDFTLGVRAFSPRFLFGLLVLGSSLGGRGFKPLRKASQQNGLQPLKTPHFGNLLPIFLFCF